MLLKKISCFLLFGLLLLQCKKTELPPPDAGTPVFTLNFELDGAPVNFVAGEEDYFMFTDFQATPEDVLVFEGTLNKLSCVDSCGPALKILIRDRQSTNAGNFQVDSSFATTAYNYVDTTAVSSDTTYIANFTSNFFDTNPAVTPMSYNWSFGDGTTSNEVNPSHVYPDPSDRQVFLEITASDGGVSQIDKPISFFQTGSNCEIDFMIGQAQWPVVSVLGSITPLGTPFFLWTLSNGQVDSLNTALDVSLQAAAIDPLQICLEAVDGQGCFSSRCKTIVLEDPNPSTATISYSECNFQVETIEEINGGGGNDLNLAQVTVIYTDENGTNYSSDIEGQPSTSFFQIAAVESFEQNDNGQNTIIATLSFSCTVFSETGSLPPLEISNAMGTFGFAHP